MVLSSRRVAPQGSFVLFVLHFLDVQLGRGREGRRPQQIGEMPEAALGPWRRRQLDDPPRAHGAQHRRLAQRAVHSVTVALHALRERQVGAYGFFVSFQKRHAEFCHQTRSIKRCSRHIMALWKLVILPVATDCRELISDRNFRKNWWWSDASLNVKKLLENRVISINNKYLRVNIYFF